MGEWGRGANPITDLIKEHKGYCGAAGVPVGVGVGLRSLQFVMAWGRIC